MCICKKSSYKTGLFMDVHPIKMLSKCAAAEIKYVTWVKFHCWSEDRFFHCQGTDLAACISAQIHRVTHKHNPLYPLIAYKSVSYLVKHTTGKSKDMASPNLSVQSSHATSLRRERAPEPPSDTEISHPRQCLHKHPDLYSLTVTGLHHTQLQVLHAVWCNPCKQSV